MVLCMLGCNPRFWLIIRRLLTRTQTLEGPHMEGYDLPEFSKQFQKKKWCLDNLYWANRKVALTKPDWKLTFLIVVTVKEADPPATLFTMDLSQRKFPSSLAYMPKASKPNPQHNLTPRLSLHGCLLPEKTFRPTRILRYWRAGAGRRWQQVEGRVSRSIQ